jgi:type IV secretion system protein TrbL
MRGLGLLIGGALLLCGGSVFAVDLHDSSRTYMTLLELVKNTSHQWGPRLHSAALYVFWSLATIQLAWIFAQLVLKMNDISVFFLELLRWIMVTGFFFAILENFVSWAQAVVDSFRQAGAVASGTGIVLHPGNMFGLAVELAHMVAEAGTMNIADGVLIALSAMIILASFVFIAVFMGVTLIESYIAVNAGVLFMGFGGSQWTREFAISLLKYPLSVGAKLFVLHLIVDMVMNSARDWQHAYHHDQASMWTLVGLALVCAYLSKTIPDMIQALINGVSTSGGSSLGGMAAAGMAFGAGAMASLQSSGVLGGIGSGIGSVADSVKSSLGMSSGGSSMNQMSGGASGGGYSSGPSSTRTGGGGNANPGPAPSQAGASGANGNSGSSGPSGPVSGGSGSTLQPSSSSPVSTMSAATAAHMATDAAVRSAGVLASMAVPGMEGSESLSVGAPPTPPDYSDIPSQSAPVAHTPENIIRPASSPAAAGPTAQPAAPPTDTMNDLQEILNNQGKPPHENV